MPTNYKILGQSAPAANSEVNNYTVPSSTSALVKSIIVSNTSSTADTFSIALKSTLTGSITRAVSISGLATGSRYSDTGGTSWVTGTFPFYPPSTGNRSWAYGNGLILFNHSIQASDRTGTSSTDGITWTSRSTTAATNGPMTFGNGLFLAVPQSVASSSASISTDGVSWTLVTMPSSQFWYNLKFGNNKFVAIQGNGNSTAAAYSTDATTWQATTMPSSQGWQNIIFANNIFHAIAWTGGSATSVAANSTDGITWTQITVPSGNWRGFNAVGNGKVLALGTGTTARVSTDSITWTAATLPVALDTITFAQGNFIGYSSTTRNYYTSTDAVSWTTVTGAGTQYQSLFALPVNATLSTDNKDYIAFNSIVPGSSTVSIKAGYTIPQNSGIRVKSTNGTSTFSTFGAEIS
jgi:hypothetical protein